MSRLKLINARNMEKLLFNIGFTKIRQKGSHALYRHDDGRITTIPFHPQKFLARPLIREILNEINLSIEEYNDLITNM